jgi:hypothetical protein
MKSNRVCQLTNDSSNFSLPKPSLARAAFFICLFSTLLCCCVRPKGCEEGRKWREKKYRFNCVFHDVSDSSNLLCLTYSLCSSHCLQFNKGIPLRLENVYTSCDSEIQTDKGVALALKTTRELKNVTLTLQRLCLTS